MSTTTSTDAPPPINTVNPADPTGLRDFETDPAIIGLTSSFDEFLDIGREQFMDVFEEDLDGDIVLRVTTDLNKLLDMAEVRAPHNDNLTGSGIQAGHMDLEKVGLFEYLLKAKLSEQESEDGVERKSWHEFTTMGDTTGETTGGAGTTLTNQMRIFLANFFDKNRDLNKVYVADGDDNTGSLAHLDTAKIQTELSNLKNKDSATTTHPSDPEAVATYGDLNAQFAPVNRKCFATNLMSVRQIAQVLEAIAGMGVVPKDGESSSSARVVRAKRSGTDDTVVYKYKLRPKDSIIGECTVYDSDALANTARHSKNIKVQLIQDGTEFVYNPVDYDVAAVEAAGADVSGKDNDDETTTDTTDTQ